MKIPTISKKALTIIAGVLLILMLGAYMGRGWIRTTLVPAYVQAFYMSGVDKNFSKNFSVIDQRLATFGFAFTTNYDECWSGGNVWFDGFSESVTCIKSQESNAITVTDGLKGQWKTGAPQLEQLLLANGWYKTYDEHESLTKLLQRRYMAAVNYAKDNGKTHCKLTIAFSPSDETNATARMWSQRLCQRDVEFFGGA